MKHFEPQDSGERDFIDVGVGKRYFHRNATILLSYVLFEGA
jgi:hypothetical protein